MRKSVTLSREESWILEASTMPQHIFGNVSSSELKKRPGNVIFRSLRDLSIKNSISYCIRTILEAIDKLDLNTPLNHLRGMIDLNECKAMAGRSSYTKGLNLKDDLDEWIAMIAQDGALDDYYKSGLGHIRVWTREVGEILEEVLQSDSKNFSPQEIAQRFYLTHIGAHWIDIRLQENSEMLADDDNHVVMSVVNKGIRQCRHAALMTTFRSIFSDDPESAEQFIQWLLAYRNKTRNFNARNIAKLAELPCHHDLVPHLRSSVLHAIGECIDDCSNGKTVNQLAEQLKEAGISEESPEKTNPPYYPNGQITLIVPSSDIGTQNSSRNSPLLSYTVDPTKYRRTLAISAKDDCGLPIELMPLYPRRKAFPHFRSQYFCTLSHDGQVASTESGFLAEEAPFAHTGTNLDIIRNVDNFLNQQIQQLAITYPAFFETLHKQGPVVCVRTANSCIMIVQGDENEVDEMAQRLGSTEKLEAEDLKKLMDSAELSFLAFEGSNRSLQGLCLPVDCPQRSDELSAQQEQLNASSIKDNEKQEWKRRIRQFKRPEIVDLLKILKEIPRIRSAEISSGDGKGGHIPIHVIFVSGEEYSIGTCSRTRKKGLKWSEFYGQIKDLNLSLEEVYQAMIDAGIRHDGKFSDSDKTRT